MRAQNNSRQRDEPPSTRVGGSPGGSQSNGRRLGAARLANRDSPAGRASLATAQTGYFSASGLREIDRRPGEVDRVGRAQLVGRDPRGARRRDEQLEVVARWQGVVLVDEFEPVCGLRAGDEVLAVLETVVVAGVQ